jgi:serine protease inhibitor
MSNMRGRWRLTSAAVAALLVAGCGSNPAEIPAPVQHMSMKLTDSSTSFGLTLLDRLLAEQGAGNVFISPLSATIALSMAASAAQGDTRAAMLHALGLDPTIDPSGELRQTIQRLNQSDANAQLELAQAVWAQNGLKLSPNYVAKLRDDYQAELGSLDFRDPNAPEVVNRWVDSRTHHKITRLVDQFDPSTVGYLVNATYFHALWATEFKPLSSPVAFRQFTRRTVSPPMMHRDESVIELHASNYVAELLPYKGGRFSAVLILPARALSPSDFATFLTLAVWQQTMAAFHNSAGPTLADKCKGAAMVICDGTLQMPQFKLDYQKDLTSTLHSMGMPIPASLPDFCDGCYVSTVVQATRLEVDEKGTTAAAATGVAVATAMRLPTIVDRPFAFALIDNATDAPLFLGAIGNLG